MNKKSMTEQLATAPIGKMLVRLAIPSLLAHLITLLYTVVDRAYIGHIPGIGDAALTGVGVCFPILTLIQAFTVLIAQGGAPRASMMMGKKDMDQANKILGNCTISLFGIAIILMVIFLVFGRSILMVFGASEATIGYAYPYLMVYVLGSVFVMMSLGLNQFIVTQGFTKQSMFGVLLGAVMNLILDPLFIFVFHWGVRGAAFATIISQAAVFIYVLRFFHSSTSVLHIYKKNFRLDLKLMLPVIALGLAPFIMLSTDSLMNLSFNFSLQKYGGDVAVGAMTIAGTMMQLFFVPANGLGQGAQPIISYNYGAENQNRVKRAVFLMFVVITVYTMASWTCVELFPQVFIRIFSSAEGEVYQTAIWALRLYVGLMGAFGLQCATQQALVATGQAKLSIFIACLRKLILLIPLIFILPHLLADKVFAVFLAEPLADAVSISVAFIAFLFTFRKLMKQMEERKKHPQSNPN